MRSPGLVLIPTGMPIAEVCLLGLTHLTTCFHGILSRALVFIHVIVHTLSKMHLLGANNFLMTFKSNKLLFNYDSLFSYSAIT